MGSLINRGGGDSINRGGVLISRGVDPISRGAARAEEEQGKSMRQSRSLQDSYLLVQKILFRGGKTGLNKPWGLERKGGTQ